MDKKIILGIFLVALALFGGVFLLQLMKSKQVEQNMQLTKDIGSNDSETTDILQSACDKDGLQLFDGKYYSFTYPCQYDLHINSSDDRMVSFGSSDYLARLEKDGGLITNPQGYLITVSYNEIQPSIREPKKNSQELWLEWMGRGMGSIGKQEFIGVTKGEDGKDIFKSVVRGFGFMEEMKEKQVNVRIGLHNDDYTKSVEIEILTPEKDFDQNGKIFDDLVKSIVIK